MIELRDRGRCVRRTIVRALREESFDERTQVGRHRGRVDGRLELRRLLVHVLREDDDSLADERHLAGDHLEEHHADGVEIDAVIDLLPHGLLRGHVRGRAVDRAHAREVRAAPFAERVRVDLRDAEIEDLHHL